MSYAWRPSLPAHLVKSFSSIPGPRSNLHIPPSQLSILIDIHPPSLGLRRHRMFFSTTKTNVWFGTQVGIDRDRKSTRLNSSH